MKIAVDLAPLLILAGLLVAIAYVVHDMPTFASLGG